MLRVVNARVRKHTDMRFSHVSVFSDSHVRVFSDSRNVQKSVTRIIYLGPLPSLQGLKLGLELEH